MAERHGCGDKAREQARGTWIAQNSSHRPLSETEREKARTEVKKKVMYCTSLVGYNSNSFYLD